MLGGWLFFLGGCFCFCEEQSSNYCGFYWPLPTKGKLSILFVFGFIIEYIVVA